MFLEVLIILNFLCEKPLLGFKIYLNMLMTKTRKLLCHVELHNMQVYTQGAHNLAE